VTTVVPLALARMRRVLSEPEACFGLRFPIVLAFALVSRFETRARQVQSASPGTGDSALVAVLIRRRDSSPRCSQRDRTHSLRTGRIALLVVPAIRLSIDTIRPARERLARLQVDEVVPARARPQGRRGGSGRSCRRAGSRYIDFLIPGLLGMNLLAAYLGVGFSWCSASEKVAQAVHGDADETQRLPPQLHPSRLVFLIVEIGLLVDRMADVGVGPRLVATLGASRSWRVRIRRTWLLVASRARRSRLSGPE